MLISPSKYVVKGYRGSTFMVIAYCFSRKHAGEELEHMIKNPANSDLTKAEIRTWGGKLKLAATKGKKGWRRCSR